jgi:predicted HD superfamily hydrolase involved in NAD metabolism
MYYTKLRKEVKPLITKKRMKHSEGVVDAAEKMAQIFDVDVEKARIAAILHDCAKNFSKKELIKEAKRFNLKVDSMEMAEPQLLHGPVGAIVARERFGVVDEEILNAIRYHTTGRRGMSKLEKIIYVSDFTEPSRNFPGIEILRKLSGENLDEATLLALNNTVMYVISIGSVLHPRTIEARNEIVLRKYND